MSKLSEEPPHPPSQSGQPKKTQTDAVEGTSPVATKSQEQMGGVEGTDSEVSTAAKPKPLNNKKGRGRGKRKLAADDDGLSSFVESESERNNKEESSNELNEISAGGRIAEAPPGRKKPRRVYKRVLNLPEESPLLKFLSSQGSSDLAGVLLEHVAAGDGGGKAILNLRKVCQATKHLVDSLTPAQAKQIFFDIPIRLTPTMKALRSFRCPPTASSLDLTYNSTILRMLTKKGLEYLKKTCPKFMNFWANQMQTLSIDSSYCCTYSRDLLSVFGPPMALKNLGCRRIETDRDDPSLRQLERVCFYDPPGIFLMDLSLFNISSRAIKTVKMSIYGGRNNMVAFEAFRNSNLLNTEFDVEVNYPYYLGMVPIPSQEYSSYEQFKEFVLSVAESTSTIRLSGMDLDDQLIDHVQQICSRNLSKKFFKTFKTVELQKTTERVAGIFREEMFQNLVILQIGRMDAKVIVDLREHFESILRCLPASLKSLDLADVPAWTAEEWVENLSVICQRCPWLYRLSVRLSGTATSTWKSIFDERREQLRLPEGAFKYLRTLKVFCGVDEGSALDVLLFEIFRMQDIPLLNFKLYVWGWDSGQVFTSDCIERIRASSVLSKSLVMISLGLPYNESYRKLNSVVEENERQRNKNYGKSPRYSNGFFWKNFSANYKCPPYYGL